MCNLFTAAPTDCSSLLYLGDVTEALAGGAKEFKHKIAENNNGLWKLELEFTMINSLSMQGSTSEFAIPDPSSQFITMPVNDFQYIIEEIKSKTNDFVCTNTTSPAICSSMTNTCSSYYDVLPKIAYIIDAVHYSMPPQAYTFSTPATGYDYDSCTLLLAPGETTNTVVLGVPFI